MQKPLKYLPIVLIVIVLAVCAYCISKLKVYENLNTSIPGNAYFDELEPILEKGKRTLIFSVDIQKYQGDNIRIDSLGSVFSDAISVRFANRLKPVQYQSDVDPETFADFVHENLFLFLEAEDYETLENRINPQEIGKRLQADKIKLSNVQSIGMASFIAKDPLQFDALGFAKLGKTVDIEKLAGNDGLYISQDKSKLLLTSALLFDPQEVVQAKSLATDLAQFTADWNSENPQNSTDHFGTFLITQANAAQIKSDIILTVNLALLFIVGLLFFYYRSVSTIFFFVLPGLFGIAVALSCMYIFNGGISALALSAGAVILGIVVDYSFHYFSHLSQEENPFKTRNKILVPLIISSATTVIAFFSLAFANSDALRDFGIFTGLSLIFTLLFILFFLPSVLQFFQRKSKPKRSAKMDQLVGRFEHANMRPPSWLLLVFVGLTIVMGYFATDVQFEDDLNKINYYPEALKAREIAHQNINPDAQKRITVVAYGSTNEEAVSRNRTFFKAMNAPKNTALISELNSIGGFVFSEEQATQKAKIWNDFWSGKQSKFKSDFNAKAQEAGFNPTGFSAFLNNVFEEKEAVNSLAFATEFSSFKALVVQEKNTNILNSIIVEKENYPALKKQIEAIPGVFIVDGAGVAAALVQAIKDDFNLLLLIASITVFVTMLLVYGRIEVTLISFLPMAISWVWILGMASLFDIKFNFINIIIATIIFGLGDDFAIFITEGLQERYKFKTKGLATHQAGILLSSISTIIGTGVLFFGQHPAIKSIAAVSVMGIATIVLVSFVVQPVLYRWIILNRSERGKPPYTLVEILLSIYAFFLFPIGSIIISIGTILMIVLPFVPKKTKKLVVHKLIRFFTGFLINTMFLVKKRYYDMKNLDFNRPSIIIANHNSFLDILMLSMRHPKVIILVGPWVYNSPIFGWFIRYADYIPAFTNIDDHLEKIENLVRDGYSVVVYPEGHRSPDGTIKRFHKGAFYLSEKLQIDITPVLLHGIHYTLPKGEYYVKSSYLNLKVLPRIAWDDAGFGAGYSKRTKAISAYFKEEYAQFAKACENPDYLAYPLQYAYLYKGPILEWYFKIKYKYEKQNYAVVDEILGVRNRIFDLGCGYGFLSYFLKLRDETRIISGLDFDQQKIDIAQNNYLKTPNINFEQADISNYKLESADAFILIDVLHYLDAESQLLVLENCRQNLSENGLIILKDGLADNAEKHAWTLKSERWSTRWLKFNKTQNELHFFTKQWLVKWAKSHGLLVDVLSESAQSSNTLLAIRKG